MVPKLRIWHKLALMMVPLLAVAVLLGVVVIRNDQAQVRATELERGGVEFLAATADVLGPLQWHGVAAIPALAGDTAAREELATAAAAVDAGFLQLVRVEAGFGERTDLASRIDALRMGWEALRDGTLSASPGDSEAQHRSLALALVALQQQVADRTRLRHETLEEAQRLTVVLSLWAPRAMVNLAAARTRGAAIIVRGAALPEDQLALASYFESVAELQREVDDQLAAAFEANAQVRAALVGPYARSHDNAANYREFATSRLRGSPVTTTLADHAAMANPPVDDYLALSKAGITTLGHLVAARAERTVWRRNLAVGGFGVALLLAVALTWWVSGDVRRQVASIREAVTEVEAGRLAARADVLTHDELGGLAASINAMFDNTLRLIQSRDERDRIQASVMKLLEEVSGVAEGDLTREAEVTADVTGTIADSFNYMIGELRTLVADVQQTSRFVGEAASTIDANVSRLALASETQFHQIAETTTAVADMAASIQRVSQHAATSAAVADEARATAHQGAAVVERTRHGMEVIRDHVQETSKRIKRLGENAQEVGGIVALIGDIADRTSILSLNASIQAAAAGEAGRGFAVVASEVERLAERAADATKRITTIIKTTQTETAGALAAMEDTTREVVSGSTLATEAADALGRIERVSAELAEHIRSISVAAKTQADGSEVVARAMQSISVIAQQTAPAARTASQSATELAERTEKLSVSVGRFKLPELSTETEDAA